MRIDIGRKEYSITDSGRADQNHQVLDARVPWDEGGADLVGRLALEQGRRWSSINAQWARWAAKPADPTLPADD